MEVNGKIFCTKIDIHFSKNRDLILKDSKHDKIGSRSNSKFDFFYMVSWLPILDLAED